MAKKTSTGTKALGDAEVVLLASGGQHPARLIEILEGMKPVTRQRAAANLVKQGLAEERTAGPNDPIWRDAEDGRFSLAITSAGLAAIGIKEGAPAEPDPAPAAEGATPPRDGSKGAQVVSLLSRTGGASIDELIEATGWLPHTTRAALTGLRKRGYAIERSRSSGGVSVYRIPNPEPVAKRSRKGRTADVQVAI